MPGHKGNGALGCEALDLTEINGADVLYSADGIIAESEANTSTLFGSYHTFYSTEGSTLCIKAMLALAAASTPRGQRPLVLAARNVHKAFIYAAALLDLDVEWLYPQSNEHLCACKISAEQVKCALESTSAFPCAVYITSPDYLGNIADVARIAKVCDSFGVPLLVDNAHGAYLKFLQSSLHPIDLGASMCCDSAHKTLPVLTGGAYLHIASKASAFADRARVSLSVFASTSPSYLTLCSLDLCCAYLSDGYAQRLASVVKKIADMKRTLRAKGFELLGDEPLKITLGAHKLGYTGIEIAEILRGRGIECEFADEEYTVLMASSENTAEELDSVLSALCSIEVEEPIEKKHLCLFPCERAMSVRDAIFGATESVSTSLSIGRVCASPTVSCPPAVPIAVSGEIISANAALLLEEYGITSVDVVKN